MSAHRIPAEVLRAWGFEGATVTAIDVGLINQTFRVDVGGATYALQRLHPIFRGELNLDIEAITEHLAVAKGVATPRLVRTRGGEAWLTAGDAEAPWRVLTWLEGRGVERLTEPTLARTAAAHVARFHGALADLEHTFNFTRPGAHDTARHMAHLDATLRAGADHANFEAIAPIGERILRRAERLPDLAELPRRIIHGDLKITNVLFDQALREALALIDLDTLAHGTIAVELGDALRSWCNPAGENAPRAAIDVALFRAAVGGYATQARGDEWGGPSPEEVAAIVPGLETIALELAARFCADAIEESYFGWNSNAFPSRSEHNRVRASSQLTLAESIDEARFELEKIVARAFEL